MDLCKKGEEVAKAAFVGPPLKTRRDTIKEIQMKLGIEIGTGFKNGGLAGILEE